MNRLIYHSPGHINQISPFDSVLMDIVKDKKIKIACPYIGTYYIKRLIALCKEWVLLTDVNAWIDSQSSKVQRKNIYEFLIQHQERIRHYPELHAKVIITDSSLFLGSSNFTDNGIFRKNEMSILVTEADNIQEANQWFDDWWKVSSFPSQEELRVIINSDKCTRLEESLVKVKSKAPNINTTEVSIYSQVKKKESSILHISEITLTNYLQKWDNKLWEWNFFELLKRAIDLFGLAKDDKYLTLTLTKTGSITFQINNRYVLKSHSRRHPELIGLMMPLKFRKHTNEYQDEIYDIESFTKNKSEVALWVLFKKKELTFDNRIIKLWEEAIKEETNRKYLSPYKRFHQEIIYDIAIDIEKREELFMIFDN